MTSTIFPPSGSQLTTPSPATLPAQSPPVRVAINANLFQSMHIRYELCRRTDKVVALYRDGYSVAGYDAIDQFLADMAADGWQVDSTQQARSCSLHFAVLKRTL